MEECSSQLYVRQVGWRDGCGQVMQDSLNHGMNFGLYPKDRKIGLCGISSRDLKNSFLVFRSSWPLVRRVIWSGVNVARLADQGMLVVAQPLWWK